MNLTKQKFSSKWALAMTPKRKSLTDRFSSEKFLLSRNGILDILLEGSWGCCQILIKLITMVKVGKWASPAGRSWDRVAAPLSSAPPQRLTFAPYKFVSNWRTNALGYMIGWGHPLGLVLANPPQTAFYPLHPPFVFIKGNPSSYHYSHLFLYRILIQINHWTRLKVPVVKGKV